MAPRGPGYKRRGRKQPKSARHRVGISRGLRKHYKSGVPLGWEDFLAAAHPQEQKYVDATRRLWRCYGLTVEALAWMWYAQSWCCAICRKYLHEGPGGAVVDHDHKTGRVRGVLCTYCNYRVLSVVERAVRLIPAALAYLQGAV